MKILVDILSILSISLGVFFYLAGTVGLLRFPDPLSRLHALTKADNLGLGLVILGLLPRTSDLLSALKLGAVWVFLLFASSIAAQLAGRLAHQASEDPPQPEERP